MINLFWSFLFSIILTPQPAVLDIATVTHLRDVSCLIHAKEVIPNEETGFKKNHMIGCSGTFVSDDEVLTAAHCFQYETLGAWVRTPTGDSHKVDKILKISYLNDLALLRVVGPKHVSAKLATHPLRQGEAVYAVGSPLFFEFLLSEGIVSAIDFTTKDPRFKAHYTVSTASINSGSSGGGLFNKDGELVGVNTMTAGCPFGWAGITMSVDLDTIKEFLHD